MKASELIKVLEEEIKKNGDLECKICSAFGYYELVRGTKIVTRKKRNFFEN